MRPTFSFYNQWYGLFNPITHNWVDFTLFDLSFEIDRVFCLFKIDLSVLGLCNHFCLQYAEPDNEHYNAIKDALDGIQSSIKDKENERG